MRFKIMKITLISLEKPVLIKASFRQSLHPGLIIAEVMYIYICDIPMKLFNQQRYAHTDASILAFQLFCYCAHHGCIDG